MDASGGTDAVVTLDDQDERLLRLAIAISSRSREHGNHPFGAVLADEDGDLLLEAENSVITTGDATGHAEMGLIRVASRTLSAEARAKTTLYSSAEPCAFAGAIYWGGVGRVVYAMAESDLRALTGSHPDNPTLDLDCRTVFRAGQRHIEVSGPALGEEAIAVHEGFWD